MIEDERTEVELMELARRNVVAQREAEFEAAVFEEATRLRRLAAVQTVATGVARRAAIELHERKV